LEIELLEDGTSAFGGAMKELGEVGKFLTNAVGVGDRFRAGGLDRGQLPFQLLDGLLPRPNSG
jgi:hypothetical protein